MGAPEALSQEPWTVERLYRYVQSVEASYRISVKFWLQLELHSQLGPVLVVHAAGSGDVFDRVPLGTGTARVVVLPSEDQNLVWPVYSAVRHLERRLCATLGLVLPPPAP